MIDPQDPFIYITRNGARIPCQAVMPNLVAAVRETIALPAQPTYLTIETIAHTREEHPLDETIVYDGVDAPLDKDGLPLIFPDIMARELSGSEQRTRREYERACQAKVTEWRADSETNAEQLGYVQKWREYVTEYLNIMRERHLKVVRFLIIKGALLDLPEEDEGWITVQEYAGVEVPKGPFERKVHYYHTELLNGAEELADFISHVIGLGTQQREITYEAIRAAEAAFPDSVRSGSGTGANGHGPERVGARQGGLEL